MPHDELKPKDRVVLRMTRDGAVEENLTESTSEKVSKRLEDAQLVGNRPYCRRGQEAAAASS